MARGWFGSKEAHRAAALKGWITRRHNQRNKRDQELAQRREAEHDQKAREALAAEQARVKWEAERVQTAEEKEQADFLALRQREREWEAERKKMAAYRKRYNISFATGKKRETKRKKAK